MMVSHETIYKSLFVQARGVLKKELISRLRTRRLMRRGKSSTTRGQPRGQIVDAVSIRQRPVEVEDRAIPGHWEGDLLAGGKNSHIATLVERQSRFVMLVRVPGKDTDSVVGALVKKVKHLPAGLMSSLTWDRGTELADHKRFIGRISYSLYLVHWPLIVLYRHWAVVPPSPRDLVGLFVISIAIGGLLFVCVERFHRVSPEPKISWLFVGPTIVRSAGAAIENALTRRQAAVFRAFLILPIATAGFGAMVILRDGFPERIKKWRVQQSTTELSFAGDMCNNSSNRCVFGEISSSRIVYLIGDSYALNLVFGLDRVFKDAGIRGIALYDHGCLFLKGTKRFISGVADGRCEKNVAFAFDQMARDRHPVILAGNYGGYMKSIGLAHADAPFDGSGADYFMWISGFFRASLRAIDANNRAVIILADSYSTHVDTAKCAMQFGWENSKCTPASLEQSRQNAYAADSMLAGLRGDFPRLNIIDPKPIFCTDEGCIVRENGFPYFRDASHLTNEGSAYLAERMKGDILAIVGSAL